MNSEGYIVKSKSIKDISVQVIPGHFATNHSHINHYVDFTEIKVHHKIAKQAAVKLAAQYIPTTIDTIVCQEGTEMIGAFMADELSQRNVKAMNNGVDICVLAPEVNSSGQLVFRENTIQMVRGRNILLLISSISTGKTVNRVRDCLNYYTGFLVGICALFSVVPEINGIQVNSIFTSKDIPSYRSYPPESCELCDKKQKIDAIVNSFGYSKL
jgi:orotate phosphoribosyltransferase